VHDKDGGRIRYQRKCEICGKVVDYEHIDKAYDDGDRTVILTADDLGSLPAEKSREIDVVEFVPSEQVDPIMLEKTYYLEPDSKSLKAYALLRKTLEETDRTAIVQFALRQKTRLGALRVRGDVLVLQSLLWDDEVREAKFPSLDEKVSISAKELEMSEALVKSFEADFEPSRFTDEYQEQLRELIEAKLKKGDALDTAETFGEEPESEGAGEVLDLMEALRRSVERSKPGKSTAKGGGSKSSGAKSSASKSTASKSSSSGSGSKSAAKKPAAKKTAEKSTTTRKRASA
jgi:DNA end-binding protein Ku